MRKFLLIFFLFNLLVNAQGYVCAIGGGSENYNDWSDAPYQWIVDKARNKKIIILSYSSDVTSWLPNYFLSKGAVSVYNKAITSRAAADLQSTYDELILADGIFLRGGDQYQYISLWKGTKTGQAIQDIFLRGGVIAGTSAGAMVLGEFNFTAKNGSAASFEALNSPTSSLIDIDTSFLPLIKNVLFDTHFIERGRFGRAIASLYKSKQNFGKNILAVGIDDRTAMCIDSLGFGTVYGSGAAAIFFADDSTRMSAPAPDYFIENLVCHQLTANWIFDFYSKSISFIPASAKDFNADAEYQFPKTNFSVTGSNNISSQLNSNLNTFLSEAGNVPLLVITHPGFVQNLSQLTSHLTSGGYQFSILQLSNGMLNDPASVQQLTNTAAFIFCGDSLNILSLFNNGASLLSQIFYEKNEAEKISVFFFGNSGKTCGEYFIDNVDSDDLAGYRGKMSVNRGNNLLGEFIFQPRVFEESAFYENRVSALLYGMMRMRKRFGAYLNASDRISFNQSHKTMKGKGTIPFIIVDARRTTKIDSSIYRASGSVGPRQVVAMNNLRYSISKNNSDVYSLSEGKFVPTTNAVREINNPTGFKLYQNYPNPFNPVTKIKYAITSPPTPLLKERGGSQWLFVTLKIYDLLGNEIATLVNEVKEPGVYQVEFYANNIPAGIYFYKLQAGNFSEVKKFVLMK